MMSFSGVPGLPEIYYKRQQYLSILNCVQIEGESWLTFAFCDSICSIKLYKCIKKYKTEEVQLKIIIIVL